MRDRIDQHDPDNGDDHGYHDGSDERQREHRVCLVLVSLTFGNGNTDGAADTEQEEQSLHEQHHRLGEVDRRESVVVDQL